MSQRNLLIGVTGSIAASKTIELINLIRTDYDIKVITTYEGSNYIDRSDYKGIIIYDSWDNDRKNSYHIELSRWADEFIIYPATSNFISKLTHGVSDDVLTTTVLMYKNRIKIFPAMHEEMYLNDKTQNNLSKLVANFDIYGPRYGELDIGDHGIGRLLEPYEVRDILYDIKNDPIYVISGPTREYIDDIRYISNPSSGKQGRALALEAHARGYSTTHISSVRYPDVNRIKQLYFTNTKSLVELLNSIDISNGYLFMPAAISDFIPEEFKGKLNRRDGEKVIKLSPNIDIIKKIKEENPQLTVVGFSAELNNDIDVNKMNEKKLDYLISNNVSNKEIGFESENNQVTIIDKNLNIMELSFKSKYLIAKEILDYVVK